MTGGNEMIKRSSVMLAITPSVTDSMFCNINTDCKFSHQFLFLFPDQKAIMSATKFQTILVLVTLAVCFSSTIAQLAGGVSEADVNDETIKEMAAFAVSELGSDYSLANITSAGKQVWRFFCFTRPSHLLNFY